MSIIKTGSHILVELVDLVNSVIIFLSQMTQMVNFPTWIPDCDSHSPPLLDFFLSSDVSICSTMTFPPLGNSDHIVVSVSIVSGFRLELMYSKVPRGGFWRKYFLLSVN